ncbi:methylated-DNA--[protein]-cysteine S-methyltransferase [Companilactobacillus ginsenosidimutans]|uniref:Methylated-DNA--protein-cysteine methyltransferase n=1 Tax=Companilactobacillus ginsenosidimutans TaxID=1007676 RepID=A0A0H4QGM2_9LACO|nr:methylated-DNA--[protein]-cysteine S-methyltransferase [Companilactobacillus ginsenosidimutans]AKP67554.1 6-O-methylguanine DNA methyltransferase [Companilactobacillus ginsenosidimutans]
MYLKSVYASPLGEMTLLAKDEALVGVWFSDQAHFGAGYDLDSVDFGESHPLSLAASWLDSYFAGERPSIDSLPLAPEVTEFRGLVLSVLESVPYGSTITYKEIATRITDLRGGRKSSARAVGGAVGHNPISIIIPCHRVVGSNGSLTGYAGGISRKIALLDLEGAAHGKFI